MPEYVYTCVCKNELTVIEPMQVEKRPTCPKCGLTMWRKPQPFRVNWNGLKPSDGELPPEIRQHVDSADENRERTDEFYERRKGWVNTEEVHNPQSD